MDGRIIQLLILNKLCISLYITYFIHVCTCPCTDSYDVVDIRIWNRIFMHTCTCTDPLLTICIWFMQEPVLKLKLSDLKYVTKRRYMLRPVVSRLYVVLGGDWLNLELFIMAHMYICVCHTYYTQCIDILRGYFSPPSLSPCYRAWSCCVWVVRGCF